MWKPNEDLTQQPAILVQPALFVRVQAIERFEQFQVFNFPPEIRVATDRIVVGKGDQIGAARLGLAQDVEIADIRFLIIGRTGRMNVQIDPPPDHLALVTLAAIARAGASAPAQCGCESSIDDRKYPANTQSRMAGQWAENATPLL
jgi:hypothetical protein